MTKKTRLTKVGQRRKYSTMQFSNGWRMVRWFRDEAGRGYYICSREMSQTDAERETMNLNCFGRH
jgi:hypothetical protein